VIRIDVLGTPAGKGNARAFVNKATGRAILSSFGTGKTEKKLRSWDAAVRECAREAVSSPTPPFVDVPLRVYLQFRLARPQGHWGKGKRAGQLAATAPAFPRTKPDADKLARSTLDPLTGIVFDDDSRIVSLQVDKLYAEPGNEGATILVDRVLDARSAP
jgi:Holliday junction resolvase RusA-like endonuclease